MKCNLIVAVCDNYGIGKNGSLPWRIKNELSYFAKKTKTTSDASKKNAVIMGRKTWESIPSNRRPLVDRINIILSRNINCNEEQIENVFWTDSLEKAMKLCKEKDNSIENIWIIGGSSVYKEAMEAEICDQIYLTQIFQNFECDTYFPQISNKTFQIISEDEEIQEENGIKFQYKIYEKKVSKQ